MRTFVSLKKSSHIGHPIPMVNSENIHKSNIIQTEKGILRNTLVYTHTYIYAAIINYKGGHEFER